MTTPGRTTFQKRQKEMARKDKQKRKAERREQRKLDRTVSDKGPSQDEALPAELELGHGRLLSRIATTVQENSADLDGSKRGTSGAGKAA